nr:MAG TPA: hypothetical protein [Caudoviricetes sp.]
MSAFFGRQRAAGATAPKKLDREAWKAARAALTSLAREWRDAGLDPRDPIVEAMLRPKLEELLARDGVLAVWRAAGIDPYAVLEGAFEALDAEEPA